MEIDGNYHFQQGLKILGSTFLNMLALIRGFLLYEPN